MSQPVRRDILGQTGEPRRTPHDLLGSPHGHPIGAVRGPLLCDEERLVVVFTDREVLLDPLACALMEIGAAVPAALAEHGDLVGDADAVVVRRTRTFRELELAAIEADGLADATAAGQ